MNRYYPGNIVRLSATFTQSGALNLNPSSVDLTLSFHGSSMGITSLANPSSGFYYHDFSVSSPGEHHFKWSGYGIGQSTSFVSFLANTPAF